MHINPCRYKIAHTSCPDSTRSLLTGHLNLRDKHLIAQSLLDFRGGRTLEEQFERLAEIVPGGLDGVSLTGDIQFGTKGHEPIPFPVNHGRLSFAHIPFRTFCVLV